MIMKRRTIRRFKQETIDKELLLKLVNAARFAPSGGNMQPLKYTIVDQPMQVETVFSLVKWAVYIAPEGAPKEGERPVAYLCVLVDTQIKNGGYELEAGAAIQNILLAACEEGIGSCWMGAIDRQAIKEQLGIGERYLLNSVIALGYEAERPICEEISEGSIKYYKDSEGVLHVPKRALEDIILPLPSSESV